MLVPTIGKRFLRARKALTGKVTHKEFQAAQVRKLSRVRIIMAASPTKSVFRIRIFMNRHQRIRIQRSVDLFLRFRRTVIVLTGDMKYQRRRQPGRFIQSLFDANAVVTDSTIRFETDR